MNFLSLNIYRGSYINSLQPSALPVIRMEDWKETGCLGGLVGQMEGREGNVGAAVWPPTAPSAPPNPPNPRHATEPALLDRQPDSLSKPQGV